MVLIVQCIILCLFFTVLILPAQYRNPFSQFASYPTAIRKRVYELPEYKEFISGIEHKNWKRKILGSVLICFFFAVLSYFSGNRTFTAAFLHVFILFLTVNLYDLILFDLIIFCHSKKLRIPGTEDMDKEYRNPLHHVIGAVKGVAIGLGVSLISAFLVSLFSVM